MRHEALAMIEFSDMPSILVLADRGSAAERARRSAETAGCRVSDVAGVSGGIERLERQAGVDAVLLELDGTGEAVAPLLDALEAAAEAGRHGSVICAPPNLIDLVAARTRHSRVIHLCDATEMERVAAITLACARPTHRLQDISREQGPPPLKQISEEVGRIANMLASLSAAESAADAPEAEDEEVARHGIDVGFVRAIIRVRRLRDQFLGPDLFADPAWDILLDLFAARLEKRRVAVSSLCIAAAVPATTALRWIKMLTDVGLLVRVADSRDGRRVHIELAPKTAARLGAYLVAAQRISPLIV